MGDFLGSVDSAGCWLPCSFPFFAKIKRANVRLFFPHMSVLSRDAACTVGFPGPCVQNVQEKEFEITNEYLFALGSHVIYWSSKDVSLFVAQQVVADATAEEAAEN